MINILAFFMKEFIEEHLLSSTGKLISKRLNIGWFADNNFLDKWSNIHSRTSFLDNDDTTISERIYCIYHGISDSITCVNEVCSSKPNFVSFNKGYLTYCSYKCAQSSYEVDSMKLNGYHRIFDCGNLVFTYTK